MPLADSADSLVRWPFIGGMFDTLPAAILSDNASVPRAPANSNEMGKATFARNVIKLGKLNQSVVKTETIDKSIGCNENFYYF